MHCAQLACVPAKSSSSTTTLFVFALNKPPLVIVPPPLLPFESKFCVADDDECVNIGSDFDLDGLLNKPNRNFFGVLAFLCRGHDLSTLRNFNVAGLNSDVVFKPKKHFLNENLSGDKLSSSNVNMIFFFSSIFDVFEFAWNFECKQPSRLLSFNQSSSLDNLERLVPSNLKRILSWILFYSSQRKQI